MDYIKIMLDKVREMPDNTNERSPLFVILRSFLSMVLSYVLTEMLIGKSPPPEISANTLDQFVDIYLHGILITEPSSME